MTNLPPPRRPARSAAARPGGSGVRRKSRLRWYSRRPMAPDGSGGLAPAPDRPAAARRGARRPAFLPDAALQERHQVHHLGPFPGCGRLLSGLVIGGAAGAGPPLAPDERQQIVAILVLVARRLPSLLHVGDQSLRQVELFAGETELGGAGGRQVQG